MPKAEQAVSRIASQNSGKNSGRGRGRKGRIENLKPWPKGVSGNPGGRPKTKVLSQAYRDQLEQVVPGGPQGGTFAEKIAEALATKALKGDVQAAREVADRSEGRAQQSIALSHSNDDPLLSRADDELLYYALTGSWPSEEEREHYARTGRWPHEQCEKCGHWPEKEK